MALSEHVKETDGKGAFQTHFGDGITSENAEPIIPKGPDTFVWNEPHDRAPVCDAGREVRSVDPLTTTPE